MQGQRLLTTAGTRPRSRWAHLVGTGRRRVVLLALAICVVVCAVGSVPVGLIEYRQVSALAHDGLQHVKNAEVSLKQVQADPFDTKSIGNARSELLAANADFRAVSARVGLVPGVASILPIAGSKLGGAQKLVPLAVEGTQAGVLVCDMLNTLANGLKDPLNPSNKGLTQVDMTGMERQWKQVRALFTTILGQMNTLTPADLSLDPRLGPLVADVRAKMPQVQQALQSADAVMAILPALLGVGQPANYLLEVMDSTELRPGGGFIGNFGILTLTGGRLGQMHVQDVDLLDVGVTYGNHVIPIPPQYSWFALVPRWGFRDSNLDADFPTSARNGEQLYAEEAPDMHVKPMPLQGVVAITPWLIENAMAQITGPLYIPQYHETVTPQNLIDRIHYHALGDIQGPDTQYDPASGTSYRKAFTGYVFQAFMAKLKTNVSGNMSKLAKLLIDSLHSKDIQVYLNDAGAEGALQRYNFASAIQAPAQGDSVFEVDANIGGSKANYVLKYNLSDKISLDASGTATHHLSISYTWPNDPTTIQQIYAAGIDNRYHSYSRVYVPPSAALLAEQGWANPTTSTAFSRKVFAGTTYAYYGTTTTITLTWKVPNAATHDRTGWHYQLLFQKQAGITWPLTLQIQLPSCGQIAGTPTGMKATGTTSVGVSEPLANDLQLTMSYTGC